MPFIDNNKSYTKELVRLNNYEYVAIGYQKLTTNTNSQSLTIPDNTRYALIKVESTVASNVARYLQLGDKLPPTSTDGISLSANDVITIHGYQNLINFRIIRTGISTTTLHIEYYK